MRSKLAPDQLYRWGVGIAIVNAFLSPILQDFKLLQISAAIPAALFYAGLPTITLLFFFSLFLRKDVDLWRMDFVEATLAFAFVWGWIWVLAYGGDPADIGGNAVRLLFAGCAYKASRLYAHDPWMRNVVPWLAKWGFWGVFWALVGLYVLGVVGPFYVYLSLNSEEIYVAFAVVLTLASARRIPYSAGVFTLILLGGRRGAIVGAAAMVLAKYAMNWNAGGVKWRRGVLLGIGVSVVVGLLASLQWARSNPQVFDALPANVKLRVLPLVLATEGDDGPDATTLTGKRNVEVMAVFEQWKDDPIEALTGQGYGATWAGEEGQRDSTVHFSPVALGLLYGIPVAIAIYGMLLWLPSLAVWRAIKGTGDREEQIWALVIIGLIVLTLTGFHIFQNYVLWIGLGILRALTQRGPDRRTEAPA